jgi:hypothetical protein
VLLRARSEIIGFDHDLTIPVLNTKDDDDGYPEYRKEHLELAEDCSKYQILLEQLQNMPPGGKKNGKALWIKGKRALERDMRTLSIKIVGSTLVEFKILGCEQRNSRLLRKIAKGLVLFQRLLQKVVQAAQRELYVASMGLFVPQVGSTNRNSSYLPQDDTDEDEYLSPSTNTIW